MYSELIGNYKKYRIKSLYGNILTISSPSNMMRQFKNNLKETGMLLGQLFIPLLTKVAPVINGITIAIGRMLTDFASLFGIKIELDKMGQGFNQLDEELDSTVSGFEDAADAAREFKNQMLGFDEAEKLTTINTTSTLDGTDSLIDLSEEILKATDQYEQVWQDAYNKMNSGTQLWADKIEKTLDKVKAVLKDIVLGDYVQAGEDFSRLTLGLTTFISNAIRNVDWEKAGRSIGEFLAGIDWIEIFVSLADIVVAAIEGAVDVWFGSLKEAPFETGLITVIALWKFTKVGKVVADRIATSIATEIGSSTVLTTITGAIKLLVNNIGKVFITGVAGWSVGSAIYEALTKNEAGSIPDQISYLYNSSWDEIKSAAKQTFKDIGSYFSNDYYTDVKITFGKIKTLFDEIKDLFNIELTFKDITKDISDLSKQLQKPFNDLEKYIEESNVVDIVNTVFTGTPKAESDNTLWDWIVDLFNGDDKTSSSTKTGRSSRGGSRVFATGGFPEDGFFFANHSELVGKFDNGRTAVANNIQIQQGIEQASYRGMARALAQHQGNGGTVTVVLQGDADGLFKVVQNKANNYTMQTGQPAFNF